MNVNLLWKVIAKPKPSYYSLLREFNCKKYIALKNGLHIMNSNCDTCKNRQKPLDPDGCFKGHGTTGFIGRLLTRLLGCYGYRPWVDQV